METDCPEISDGIPQFLEAYARIIPQVRPYQFPFICYPTNFSLISLLFDIF
jgi:hypothetical protein